MVFFNDLAKTTKATDAEPTLKGSPEVHPRNLLHLFKDMCLRTDIFSCGHSLFYI